MSKDKFASVIIPTFNINNSGPSIKSVIKQDYLNREIILVNDNPTIKINEEVKEIIKKNKIILINNKKNLGIARSLNEGIKKSKSQFILILASDYVIKSRTWIKNTVNKLSKNNVGYVVTAIETEDKFWKEYPFLYKLLTFRLILPRSYGAGGSYKKEIFKKLGLFDWKTFKFGGEDGDFIYRLETAGYKTNFINDTITHNHFVKNNGSISKIIKKEYHYGMSHGARKKKYGKRVGFFDFEFRLVLFLLLFIGFIINWWLSLFSFLVLFTGAFKQSIKPEEKTGWLPGLIFYPFVGIFIFFIQTMGSINGYFGTKRNKDNKNIDRL